MKKTLLILFACLSLGITQVALSQCTAPVINSFSPNTGFIGSTVTITGANFDANPANNQVFFGATQATVLTASFGQLTVRVPVGATTAPISVKNNCNLTAYSNVSFNGIFCPTPLTTTTYQNVAFTLSGINGAYNMLSQDIDGDGKPDIVSEGFGANFTIARNTSTPGNMSFSAYNLSSPGARSVAVADFDGDGKRDILSNGYVHRNLSTPGTVNMGAAIYIGNVGYQCAAGDINGDGKIDAISGNGGNIMIAMNTSTGPGVISFAPAITGPYCESHPTGLQMADIDGDGKVDILGTQGGNDRAFTLRNVTPVGSSTPVFETVEFWNSGGSYPYRCQVADFDKDGRIDITTCNYSGSANAAVLRNTSVPGNISFATAVTASAPSSNYRIAVGDVNGDGLPDIVTKSNGQNVFSVYRNTSTGAGVISFASRIDYTSSAQAEVSGIVIGDLDGDFVPDIATSGTSSGQIRVHRNTSSQVDNTPPTAVCKNITVALSPAGTATVAADMIDNGSSDACGIGTVLINDQASVSFTCANIGANTVTLKVTDRAGNSTTCTATVNVAPAAIIVAGQSTVCQGQTVTLNANQGDSYQWQKDGVDIQGATSQQYIATVTGNYTVTVTNAGGCSGTSSPTPVTVNLNPTVNVTPAGNASLCPPNSSVVLSASTSSVYQWKKDGVNIANATQQNYNATAIGNYSVQVIDLFGCSATSAVVNVRATDDIPPVAKVKNITLALDADKSVSITAADINDGSFDNCGTVSVALEGQSTFTCADVNKVIDVTLKVTDANGIVSEAIAKVTVTDPNKYCNQAPIALAKALVLNAGSNCTATATANDFDNGSSDPDGDAITFSVSPAAPYALGTTNVVLTVTDSKGESVTVNTTVTVQDVTAPNVTAPSNVSVNADPGKCSAIVTLPATAVTDNCSGIASNTESLDEYTTGAVTGRSRMWTLWPGGTTAFVSNEQAFSGSNSLKVSGNAAGGPIDQLFLLGNQTSGNWTVSFMMYVPAGRAAYYNMQRNENPGTGDWAQQTIFRTNGTGFVNAAGTNTSFSYPQGQWFEVRQTVDMLADQTSLYINGVLAKTWKFSLNTAGQQASMAMGAFNFYPVNWVNDPSPATTPLYYVDDIKLEGNATEIGKYVSRRYSREYPVGTTPVKMQIKDKAGNTTESEFTVTVNDTEKPKVIPGAAITVNSEAGKCGANVTIPGPAVSDNCGIASVNVSKAGFFPVGTTVITWTVRDIHNNVSTATQSITVVDVQAPSITAPASVSVNNDGGVCAASNVALGTPATSDNCGVASVTNDAPASFNVGSTTVTWTVTDVHGNTNTATQTVTVTDNEAPVVITRNIDVSLVNGTVSITAAQVNNGTTDNCGIASMSVAPNTFVCGTYGPQVVTLTVTDIHGNTASKTAIVNVLGNTPNPSVTVSRTDNTFTGLDGNTISLGYGAQKLTLTASNSNPGATSYTWSGQTTLLSSTTAANPVFTPTAAGIYTYTVTAKNEWGCSKTTTVTLVVMDVRCGNNGDKVIVCHIPPGKPSNPQTICIAPSAVAAHLAKGSYLGNCRVSGARTVESTSVVVSKDEIMFDGKLTLIATPNPTSGIFTARLYNAAAGKAKVEVIGMNGNVVDVKNPEVNTSLTNIMFNLSGKAQGMYRIRAVDAKGKVTTVTVLIQR